MLYSEIFSKAGTVQGEGMYTGIPSIFVRLAACNLKCLGFGQENPYDRTTWKDPLAEISPELYGTIETLPVLKYGCDTVYAHNPKFKKFFKKEEPAVIANKIIDLLPNGVFYNRKTNNDIHLVVTGGEPFLQQGKLMSLLYHVNMMAPDLHHVTIETNGTIKLSDSTVRNLLDLQLIDGVEVLFSISPKLSLSGEKTEDAIKFDVLKQYSEIASKTQFKFVVDGTERTWNEVDECVSVLHDIIENKLWSTWVMPVGGTKEQQEEIQAKICEEAYQRGYNFSPRLQNWIFKNEVGK